MEDKTVFSFVLLDNFVIHVVFLPTFYILRFFFW